MPYPEINKENSMEKDRYDELSDKRRFIIDTIVAVASWMADEDEEVCTQSYWVARMKNLVAQLRSVDDEKMELVKGWSVSSPQWEE